MTSLYVHAVIVGLVVGARQLSSYPVSRLWLSWSAGIEGNSGIPRVVVSSGSAVSLLLEEGRR